MTVSELQDLIRQHAATLDESDAAGDYVSVELTKGEADLSLWEVLDTPIDVSGLTEDEAEAVLILLGAIASHRAMQMQADYLDGEERDSLREHADMALRFQLAASSV